jgi:thymidylate synthase
VRIYKNFHEAFSEVKRDLKEMGIKVHTQSVQDIERSDGFETLEVQNYTYTVSEPRITDIEAHDPEWCRKEFFERVMYVGNPGEAWKYREEYWKQFLHDGKFSYTYGETMSRYLGHIISEYQRDHLSRRLFIPVYDAQRDLMNLYHRRRIPCSIGYWIYCRRGKLHLTYLQRSSDFLKHFSNDVWLAHKLQGYLSEYLRLENGTFSHWLGSIHVFEEDVKDVF